MYSTEGEEPKLFTRGNGKIGQDISHAIKYLQLPEVKDITIRAIEILKSSDYILCEDTRVSKNLIKRYEIKGKLISYHKFNEKKKLIKNNKITK